MANRGEGNPLAKLTDATVAELRRRAKAGEPIAALARERVLAVAPPCNAGMGPTWRHVIGGAEWPGQPHVPFGSGS